MLQNKGQINKIISVRRNVMGEQEGAKRHVLASHLNTFSINQKFY